jgi:hypothetical protein
VSAGSELVPVKLHFPNNISHLCCVLLNEIKDMLSLFRKDPIKNLENKRRKLLEEAMHVQRSGDLKLYAVKMEAIDKLEKEIEALRGVNGSSSHQP